MDCDIPDCTLPGKFSISGWEHIRLCIGHARLYIFQINPPMATRKLFDMINKERGEKSET